MIKLRGYSLVSDLFNGTGRVVKPDGSEQMVNLSLYGGFVDYVDYCESQEGSIIEDVMLEPAKEDNSEQILHNMSVLINQNALILEQLDYIKRNIKPGTKTKPKK